MLNVDLHCHSTASDGLLSPSELVRRAAANGVTVLALTDHDGLFGLAEASIAADSAGIRFIAGVEISIAWEGLQVHILGLNFDPDNPVLCNGLEGIRSGRVERARRIALELEKCGIHGAFAGAMRYAGNPDLVSRAHFARYLVELGVCGDTRRVFDAYLVPGRPGYVGHHWPSLADSIAWIKAAGGVAIVAHPARYRLSSRALRRFLQEFKSLGGDGLEVVSGSHSLQDVRIFANFAVEFDFVASRGSDFHGPHESYTDLGCLADLPTGVQPVWTLF